MIKASREAIEKDVDAGKYVEFTLSRRGTSYACITPNAIKEVMQKVRFINQVCSLILIQFIRCYCMSYESHY